MFRRLRPIAIASGLLAIATSVSVAAGAGPAAATVRPPTASGSNQFAQHRFAAKEPARYAPGQVIVSFSSAKIDGAPLRKTGPAGRRVPHTTDAKLNRQLQALGARSIEPLLSLPSRELADISRSSDSHSGAPEADLTKTYVVDVAGSDMAAVARTLAATPGVAYAAPNWNVATFNTDPVPIPRGAVPSRAVADVGSATSKHPAAKNASNALPSNFGLASSLQSYLNRTGVSLSGAYSEIANRFHQLPGQGETITNVSIGDLTDKSMADGGDDYVAQYGPTTTVVKGQRYLDYPSMPLIPTYTADTSGHLDPLGTIEKVDPNLSEVLLDFSVMAPLPHDQQRPSAVGYGVTDLLGIAPGAKYRLVEPQQATVSGIAAALLAAAHQTPKPNVINASLGFGTDTVGFPGRYLEDDSVIRTVVKSIVSRYGIVVTISSNDGTRLYTPAAVGPDGGSAPTELARGNQRPSSIDSDALSTTPSVVPDTGTITVGGSTLDDAVAVPVQANAAQSGSARFAETRIDGSGTFSSGFGSRVNVSAPSDNIASVIHVCQVSYKCKSGEVESVLSGGTSAAAPMTAAAAADVLQVARLTGHPMKPKGVRELLARTGEQVPTPPQIDGNLQVGPQIDITAAVESLLGDDQPRPVPGDAPTLERLSIAHRQKLNVDGGSFFEMADPSYIDLQGPVFNFQQTGEALVGPITFAGDLNNEPKPGSVDYAIVINGHQFTSRTPAIRLTPTQILTAAGVPVASTTTRDVTVLYQVRRAGEVIASVRRVLTFGPSDGTHDYPAAPVVAPVVSAGRPVKVHYDLAGTRSAKNPQLIVSTVGHWSRWTAPEYNIGYSVPLTGTSGTVTVPPAAFHGGAGIYGMDLRVDGQYGAAVPVRVSGVADDRRPSAPLVSGAGTPYGLHATVNRETPKLGVRWSVRDIPGARGAAVEISAPGPTVTGLLNTFVNQNGSQRDNDGANTGSPVYQQHHGTGGDIELDLSKLGLASSTSYSVRVLATDRDGHPIGQASPVATFDYQDGPDAGTAAIDDFAADSADTMLVATTTTNADGSRTSAVRRYDPATGRYGATITSDPTGASYYQVYGVDPGLGVAAVAKIDRSDTKQSLETYDLKNGRQIAGHSIDAASQYALVGGRVDPVRHRAAVLAWGGSDKADYVLPVDLHTGTVGSAVSADNEVTGQRAYNLIDINRQSGIVDLGGSPWADSCVTHPGTFTTVNLDTRTARPMTKTDRCQTGLAADQRGGAHLTNGPLASPPMYPMGRTQTVDEDTLKLGPVTSLTAHSAIFPVVDPIHNLLIVGFVAGVNYTSDNNTMSSIGVYDLTSGKELAMRRTFNLVNTVADTRGSVEIEHIVPSDMRIVAQRGIQIDPATRTGWTFGPYGKQIQQFRY